LSRVKYHELVHTQVRRFVVMRRKREHCYACPIFTYMEKGTLKNGVNPEEHAIVYRYGSQPRLLDGETGMTKHPICVVMNENETLSPASRLNFGVQHPIQYNVKVKDLGYSTPMILKMKEIHIWSLLRPSGPPTYHNVHLETVKNARAFFKKGRVFETSSLDAEPSSGQTSRFVVIKPQPTNSIALPIGNFPGPWNTYSMRPTSSYAQVVPVEGVHAVPYNTSEPDRLYVKVENSNVSIDSTSRINLATPITIDHNISVQNIGRVVGDSVRLLDKSYAASLQQTHAAEDDEDEDEDDDDYEGMDTALDQVAYIR
ncbi:hypothetical protein EK21DRAFT_74114, partial [Setomelanomma holmii]